MVQVVCPTCGIPMRWGLKAISCPKCGLLVWKEQHGRKLSDGELKDLVERGKTEILRFKARDGREFFARLKLDGGKSRLDYEDRDNALRYPSSLQIRVYAPQTGFVVMVLGEPLNLVKQASFGLVAAWLAECYGTVTAVKLASYYLGPSSKTMKVVLSLNSQDLSRYLLTERRPRDKMAQEARDELFAGLEAFRSWSASFQREKKPRLEGSPDATVFPVGIFPWAEIEMREEKGSIFVDLPSSSTVRAQFVASFRDAVSGEQGFSLPSVAAPAVKAWVAKVRSVDKEGIL